MKTIVLHDNKNNINVDVNNNEAILKLYYQEFSFIKDHPKHKLFKKYLAESTKYVPLYDIYTDNVYVIEKHNVYDRVVNKKYRNIDKKLVADLSNNYETLIYMTKDLDEQELEKELKKNISSYESTKIKILNIKKVNKYKIMLEFLDCFDLIILFDTYVKFFYLSDDYAGKNISVCKRPSFSPHLFYINPYYTNLEIVNIALNMEIIKEIPNPDDTIMLQKLCKKVTSNDINNSIILMHHQHIMQSNKMGLIQFYSLQGAWMVNNYLRNQCNYPYKNNFLEDIILSMNELIKTVPEFDKNYIVYRFIQTDDHLKHLNINDIFTEYGFTSSTRDPFYKPETYQFGLILVKLRIPKNKKGVALLIEPFSHFHEEQEVLFPPATNFKLIAKDSNTVYYHYDKKFTQKVKTRYEFEYVSSDYTPLKKPEYSLDQESIDFMKLNKLSHGDFDDKIKNFIVSVCNPMSQFKIQFGENLYDVVFEQYNSIDAYKKFYAVTTKKGYALYSFKNNYLIFVIELTPTIMHINYYVRYSINERSKQLSDTDFLYLISSIGYYFGIERAIIYTEHLTCETQIGSYCLEFYNYLKNNTKRYETITQIKTGFLYSQLDLLKTIDPEKRGIIIKTDQDEIYQIYTKIYKKLTNKYNLADFYIWLCENNCGSVQTFINKMFRVYDNDNNPFIKNYFILNLLQYLYDKEKLHTFPLDIIGNDTIFEIDIKKKQEIINFEVNRNKIRIK